MKTMYEQYPDAFEKMKANGNESIYALSNMTYTIHQMGDAIGSPNGGAIYHWIRGTSSGARCEKRAKRYLDSLKATQTQSTLQLVQPTPKAAMFMVKVPEEYLEKWSKLSKFVVEAGGEVENF